VQGTGGEGLSDWYSVAHQGFTHEKALYYAEKWLIRDLYMTLKISPPPSEPTGASEVWLSRKALAARWQCHLETLKRWEASGRLPKPIKIGAKFLRYRLSDIEAVERKNAR
jgi:predicted DNA-binding transcriptional regulator AlpA